MDLAPRLAADAVQLILTAAERHGMPLGTLILDAGEIGYRPRPRPSRDRAEVLVRAVAGENAALVRENFPPNPLNDGGFSVVSASMQVGEARIGFCVYAQYLGTPDTAGSVTA